MIRWSRSKRDNWNRRSKQDQVEVSTRWAIYGSPWSFYIGGTPLLISPIDDEPLPLALTGAFFGLALVQCALSVGGLRQGLDHYLNGAPAPTGRLRTMAVLSAVSLAMLATLIGLGHVQKVIAPVMLLFAIMPGIANVYGLTVQPRRAVRTLLWGTVGITALFAGVGLAWPSVLATFIVCLVVGFLSVFTPRSSGWYLIVMRELEEAKEAQARLAVTEERLRFSRDLHDVVGRNLSVIALKSELAAQLAQRGTAGTESAVQQMTEVQRIARESQTEVRDVVRGYRETSLHTELAGARGVLRAAGVDCRIEETPGEEMPGTVQSALGWVVREGATNVLRHAEATRCVVRVGTTAGEPGGAGGDGGATAAGGDGGTTAVLVMENDGVRGPHTEGGSGLRGLRERLVPFGGTLSVEREESAGVFRLRAGIPLVERTTYGGADADAASHGEDVGPQGEDVRPRGERASTVGGSETGEGTGENGERRTKRNHRNGQHPGWHGAERPHSGHDGLRHVGGEHDGAHPRAAG